MRILYLLAAALLSGCANMGTGGSYQVSVDALAVPDALSHQTYVLLPSMGVAPGLEYDQYARQVESALELKGMTRADNAKTADAWVMMSYQVGDAQVTPYTVSVPQWGQTGYSSAYTTGYWSGNHYSQNTQLTPTYGVTGYQQASGTRTHYPMGIYLAAGTNEPDEPSKSRQLWEITIKTISTNGDLRSAFPYMLQGAAPFIAEDSGGVRSVRVPIATY